MGELSKLPNIGNVLEKQLNDETQSMTWLILAVKRHG